MRMRAIAALLAVLVALPAAAHHGWRWTTGGNIELTGVVQDVDLGMPHGVVTVDAEGEIWTVEVGQPWRNERAGLNEGELAEGVEIRVVGEPSADPEERLVKAERFWLGDREYVLYPERD